MNVRHLQNGIGTASLLGIAVVLGTVALDPGSPPHALSIASYSGSPIPLTPIRVAAPPLAIGPLKTDPAFTNGSHPTTQTKNKNGGGPPSGAGSTTTTTNPDPPSPQGGGALSTMPIDPPASGIPTPTQHPVIPQQGKTTTTTPTPTTKPTTSVPTRQVEGTAVTLGAGTFSGGTDVAPGLYDVTTGPNQKGSFVVTGTDVYNEVLDSSGTQGVPEIRVQISNGDQIQLSRLTQVFFTPVSTPFVTNHTAATLYPGTWTVGQDFGSGRYVATPAAGESGSFIITNEGIDVVLGSVSGRGEVPSVVFTVQSGDVLTIAGNLGQVTLQPTSN